MLRNLNPPHRIADPYQVKTLMVSPVRRSLLTRTFVARYKSNACFKLADFEIDPSTRRKQASEEIMTCLRRGVVAALALAVPALASAVGAQEVQLRYNRWLPATHDIDNKVFKPWFEEIAKETGG